MEKKKAPRLRVGDIIEIPLPGYKKAFAHYLHKDSWGNIIGVFDYIVPNDQKVSLKSLKSKPYLFPPILARIKHGMMLNNAFLHYHEMVEKGLIVTPFFKDMMNDSSQNYDWKILGNIKVENFTYPNFIWKEGSLEAINRVTRWFVYNGKENIEIGKRLPKEYKEHEYMTSYSPEAVLKRIITGKNPDEELIRRG